VNVAQILQITAEEYLSHIHLCGYGYSCFDRVLLNEETGKNDETNEYDNADDEVSIRLPRTWVSLRLQRNYGQPLYSTGAQSMNHW
jgi:hypothetical protein